MIKLKELRSTFSFLRLGLSCILEVSCFFFSLLTGVWCIQFGTYLVDSKSGKKPIQHKTLFAFMLPVRLYSATLGYTICWNSGWLHEWLPYVWNRTYASVHQWLRSAMVTPPHSYVEEKKIYLNFTIGWRDVEAVKRRHRINLPWSPSCARKLCALILHRQQILAGVQTTISKCYLRSALGTVYLH